MSRRGVSHYNMLGGEDITRVLMPGDDGTQAIKSEFARRLQTAMVAKGWNQSELARRASDCLPKPARGYGRVSLFGRFASNYNVLRTATC